MPAVISEASSGVGQITLKNNNLTLQLLGFKYYIFNDSIFVDI